MPITSSAKKALRQNTRRAKRNVVRKETYKKLVKGYRKLVAEKNTAEAAKQLPLVYQALDKAEKNKFESLCNEKPRSLDGTRFFELTARFYAGTGASVYVKQKAPRLHSRIGRSSNTRLVYFLDFNHTEPYPRALLRIQVFRTLF